MVPQVHFFILCNQYMHKYCLQSGVYGTWAIQHGLLAIIQHVSNFVLWDYFLFGCKSGVFTSLPWSTSHWQSGKGCYIWSAKYWLLLILVAFHQLHNSNNTFWGKQIIWMQNASLYEEHDYRQVSHCIPASAGLSIMTIDLKKRNFVNEWKMGYMFLLYHIRPAACYSLFCFSTSNTWH